MCSIASKSYWQRMKPPRNLNPWLVAAFIGGMIYAPLVYFGMALLPPIVLVLTGLALMGVRLLGMRRNVDIKIWQSAFLVAAFFLIGMLFLNARLAVQAYPVMVSLSVATIFGLSLRFPPTIVERIARITEPNLPPEGIIYTRRVTAVWVVFLVINAIISAISAIWGSLAQWTLWNGLLSYLLMGTLFIGEMIVRRFVRT